MPRAPAPTKVAADDAMPGGAVPRIELLLDVGRNVLLDAELVEALARKSGWERREQVAGERRLGDGRRGGGGGGGQREALVERRAAQPWLSLLLRHQSHAVKQLSLAATTPRSAPAQRRRPTHCNSGVDRVLLHLLRHVRRLDDRLTLRHGCVAARGAKCEPSWKRRSIWRAI